MAMKLWTWNVNGINDKKKRNKIEHSPKNFFGILFVYKRHMWLGNRRVLINKKLGNEFRQEQEEGSGFVYKK